MRFIDHGNWVTYVPENHPLLEYNVLFCRRISDGIDWYEFQRSELTHLDTIKLTLLLVNKKHWQVQTTARDASMLFPAEHRLIEIGNAETHEDLRTLRFDLKRGEFLEGLPSHVMRLDLLRYLYREGLLDQWERAIELSDDRMLKLSLLAERPMSFDDPDVIAIAKRLGWDEENLFRLFVNVDREVRSRHG